MDGEEEDSSSWKKNRRELSISELLRMPVNVDAKDDDILII